MRFTVTLLFVLFARATFAATAPPSLTVNFAAQAVEIAGVTPKADVYLYSVAREPKEWTTDVVRRHTRLTDDDGDGRVQWDLGVALPWRSIWLVVDLSNGSYTVAAPPAYTRAHRIELTSAHLKKDVSGEVQQMAFGGSMVDMIVVRPRTAMVWSTMLTLRGTEDESTEPGKVALSAFNLRPQEPGSEPAPKALKKDDVIFLLNSFKAEYGVVRVGE